MGTVVPVPHASHLTTPSGEGSPTCTPTGVLVGVGVGDSRMAALALGGALSSALLDEADLGVGASGSAEIRSSKREFSTRIACGLELRGSSAIAAIILRGAITVCAWLCIEVTGPSHSPSPDDAMTSAHMSAGGCIGVSVGNHQ